MNIVYSIILIICFLQLVISLRLIAKSSGKYVSTSNRLIDKTSLQSGNGEAGYKKWSCIRYYY